MGGNKLIFYSDSVVVKEFRGSDSSALDDIAVRDFDCAFHEKLFLGSFGIGIIDIKNALFVIVSPERNVMSVS